MIDKGIFGGACIALACSIYVNCENKIIGAFLFAIGLFTLLIYDGALYTGVVGYTLHKGLGTTLLVLIGNFIGALLASMVFSYACDASNICQAKCALSHWQCLTNSVPCGILMYIAVDGYKKGYKFLPFVCVPAFILGGFEHCIADLCYFIMGHSQGFYPLVNLLIIIVGNGIGAIAMDSIIGDCNGKKSVN